MLAHGANRTTTHPVGGAIPPPATIVKQVETICLFWQDIYFERPHVHSSAAIKPFSLVFFYKAKNEA